MVSKDIVMQTIKRMYDSGVDDETVKATLRDIGFSDEDSEQMIQEAKGAAPVKGKYAAVEDEESGDGGEESGNDSGGGDDSEEGGEAGDEDEYTDAEPESADDEDEKHERIAQKAAEKIRAHLDDEREERALHATTNEAQMEEHGARLQGMEDNLKQLHEKVSAPSGDVIVQEPSSEMRRVKERLAAIEAKLAELNAGSRAEQTLLKKI
ncbi:hypothetical protein KKH30_03260, partial [Candidatus Micrarchaeota archaeon]|nr:hypothetical protein [Candidatus Micrarchaeota archaeon]MBU1939755.1 hypothetical protein [Candidatus Micrarchaeota archaeon]